MAVSDDAIDRLLWSRPPVSAVDFVLAVSPVALLFAGAVTAPTAGFPRWPLVTAAAAVGAPLLGDALLEGPPTGPG